MVANFAKPRPRNLRIWAKSQSARSFIYIEHAGRIWSAQSDGRMEPSWPLSLCQLNAVQLYTSAHAKDCGSQLKAARKDLHPGVHVYSDRLARVTSSGRTYENDNSWKLIKKIFHCLQQSASVPPFYPSHPTSVDGWINFKNQPNKK